MMFHPKHVLIKKYLKSELQKHRVVHQSNINNNNNNVEDDDDIPLNYLACYKNISA